MEESTQIKTEIKLESSPPTRRSIRTKVPCNDLMIRQNILRSIPLSNGIDRNRNPKMKTRVKMKKTKKRNDLQIKKELQDAIDCEQTNRTFQFDKTAIKKETNELNDDNDTMIKPDPLDIPDNFIVTKNAGIMCAMDKSIKPVYFPTEAENSGLILFNSSSKKAILKISYPKCFVILSGQFNVDGQGIFNTGDFIKAPAGSQLGIKYLGGGDGCGRIIFFKSQS